MSRSKSSKLSAGCKLVQRHRVVRVTLKKIPVFGFLNFPFSNRKKYSRCRAILLSPLGRNVVSRAVKKSLGQSCPSCLRKLNVVVLDYTVRETF
jgi:ribosomal protein L36